MTVSTEAVPEYRLRGHRVPEISQETIEHVAQRVCHILKIRKRSFTTRGIGKLIHLLEEHDINVDVVEDKQWFDGARATVDTHKKTIYMPNKLHSDLERANPEAVRIFLHEIGHILLCHQPLLHFSGKQQPKETEDSEWQADMFADAIVAYLGLPTQERQLELKFS